jgi:uncharacterized protein (DUF1684 family)
MNYKLLLTLMLLLPVTAFAEAEDAAVAQSHEEQIKDWRQARDERLASDSGWMTLVGLEWLQEGENRVGSGASSTVKIPGGPALWGTIHVDGDELRFVPAPDSGVSVNGETATEVMLVADIAGEPTLISSGKLSFYVIFRESYALRIKDSLAPALQEFTGVKTYDFQPDWRYNARFVPAQEGQTIEIANVLGHFSLSPVYGVVEFERDGVDYRLLALGDEDSESLWFLFADRTSGRETYGAGRFLYSDGMPENGRLLVDFNKAYNPPCAFNEYSTCPLPPQQNRLDLAVTAGEKDYHSR